MYRCLGSERRRWRRSLPARRGALRRRGVVVDEATIVVPCFNEERRLDPARFLALAKQERVRLLFVDDGSSDGTREVLAQLSQQSQGRIGTIVLPENVGKAEAVRAGLLLAIAQGARVVGFLDADLATPPREVLRLLRVLDRPAVQVVLGARVALAGRRIERKVARHYIGRVFATAASVILREGFYDTQCGAKVFRVTPALGHALARPFGSRWAFDVELIGRLLVGSRGVPPLRFEDFVELPLREWEDVPGSTLTFAAFAEIATDLVRIAARLAIARRWSSLSQRPEREPRREGEQDGDDEGPAHEPGRHRKQERDRQRNRRNGL